MHDPFGASPFGASPFGPRSPTRIPSAGRAAAFGLAVAWMSAAPGVVPANAQTSPPQTSAPGPAPALPGTPPANSNLVVATVKLDSGWRASKLVGAAVYNDQDEKVGSVDDLIVGADNRIMDAIISVGGFLGVGGKLVAIPYGQLRVGTDLKVTMPGATKDALGAMPGFTYGS